MTNVAQQAGAIPFRLEPDGPQVMLITSRETSRWVIPKGNIEPGDTAWATAEREAYEEAGIEGAVDQDALGSFVYDKALKPGVSKPMTVEVYAMQVKKQARKWPEKKQRQSRWMSIAEAVALVQEPGLAALLRELLRKLETVALQAAPASEASRTH